jgi:hypothetical protein
MATNDLTPLPAVPQRIPLSAASSLLVSRALTFVQEQVGFLFAAVSWSTWHETLFEQQPDLLVSGGAVYLEESALLHLVERLSASPELAVLDLPRYWGAALAQLVGCHRQAIRAREELQATPGICGPLVHELVTTLAQINGVVAGVAAATQRQGDAQRPLYPPILPVSMLTTDLPPGACEAPDSLAVGEVSGLGAPVLGSPAPVSYPAPPRNASGRRTFREIVQQHPRSNGKTGFTVRELCQALRISAASLTEAQDNPGRLSLYSVVALSKVMEEAPSRVLADLLAEIAATKKRKWEKRRSGRVANSAGE